VAVELEERARAPNIASNHPSKQVKKASAGSRNSLEAGYSVEKVLQDVAPRSG
jgi:hypothetical protein